MTEQRHREYIERIASLNGYQKIYPEAWANKCAENNRAQYIERMQNERDPGELIKICKGLMNNSKYRGYFAGAVNNYKRALEREIAKEVQANADNT